MPMRPGPIVAVTSSSLSLRVQSTREHLPARVQAHEVDGCLGEVEADRGDLLQYAPAGWLSGRCHAGSVR